MFLFINKIFFIVFLMFFIIFNYSWLGNLVLYWYSENFLFSLLMFSIIFLILMKSKNEMNKFLLIMLMMIVYFFFNFSSFFIFLVMFEISFFPIIFMIMMKGQQIEKINALFYLLFYAFFYFMFFLFMYFFFNFNLIDTMMNTSNIIMLFISLILLMKVPVYFFHYWLPKVHVEASTSSSMILAGLLLKLGCYGLIMFLFMLKFYFLIMMMSFFGLIYFWIICMFNSDIKSILAYFSIGHMNFMIFNLMSIVNHSKLGSFILMFSHGFCSVILFYIYGYNSYNINTRLIYYYNSFFNMSIFMLFFSIFIVLLNCGIPLSNNFFSEIMLIYSMMMNYKFFMMIISIYFLGNFWISIIFLSYFFLGKKMINQSMNNYVYVQSFILFLFNFFIMFLWL